MHATDDNETTYRYAGSKASRHSVESLQGDARHGAAPGASQDGPVAYCPRCMAPLEGVTTCPECKSEFDPASILPHQLVPGTLLEGRYYVGEAIGHGGFGITYIGRDLTLDIRIAIKEYYPAGYVSRNNALSDAIMDMGGRDHDIVVEGKRRFLDEARVLAQFHTTPGIVNVRDYFEANDTAYIIMDYLEGICLKDYLSSGTLAADDVFARMAPIMDALEKVHGESIVHLDISPDNIMLQNDGTLCLMDFGAARVIDFDDPRTVSMVLKAGYAPEEQYRPKGELGPWTDIYALCATMYKCITGITPDDSIQRLHRDDMSWPSRLGVPISKAQEAVLKKGMSPQMRDRYQSIAEMRSDLVEAQAGSVRGQAEGPAGTTSRRRLAVPLVIAGVAAVLLAALFVLFPRSHTVAFDTQGGSAQPSMELARGEALAIPEAPTRDGYVFSGWFYDEGCSQPASFPLAADADLTLFAGWERARASYTVRYVRRSDKKELVDGKKVEGNELGTEVTEKAESIEGYKLDSKEAKTITITQDAKENTIVFYYLKKTGYRVSYIDQATGESIAKAKQVDGKVEGDEVSEKAPDISGYTLVSSRTKSMVLEAKAEKNRIVFSYTPIVYADSQSGGGGGYSGGGGSYESSSGSSDASAESSKSDDVEWIN